MSIFISFIQKTSSVKRICILFCASHLIFLLMMLFTFPAINNQIGTKAFDLQTFGYSVSIAESIVNKLDTQTTQLYLFPQLIVLDLFYPFLLALFLSSLLFRFTNIKKKLGLLIVIIPFLAMIFDYLENICVILLITKTLEVSESFVYMSSSFTVLKAILTSIAWTAILVYAIRWLMLKIKKMDNTPYLS